MQIYHSSRKHVSTRLLPTPTWEQGDKAGGMSSYKRTKRTLIMDISGTVSTRLVASNSTLLKNIWALHAVIMSML